MGFLSQLALIVLAVVKFSSGQTVPPSNQTLDIGNDDPCAEELGVSSPSDNLSCEFVVPGGMRCYSRSELCNGDQICLTGSDEGDNIAALDCTGLRSGTGVPTFGCNVGENITLDMLCDGNSDCTEGDDESTPLCENKCRLPYYGGCPYTRECLTSALDVGCPRCIGGFVEDPANPGGECFPQINITLELSAYTAAEGDGFVELCAVIVGGGIEDGQTIITQLATSPGTASTVDFGELNPPAALVFTDNQQRTCANITIIDDNIVEGPETFSVTLSSTNFQVDVLSSNVPVFIADNEEALFEFTQNVYIGLEGTTFPFAIRLASESGVLSQPVTMMVISGDGSALANIDYVPVGISLTFPAGSGPLTSLESVLVPLDDIRVEPNKSLTLNASIAAGTGSITPNGSTALVVIQDNDVLTIGFERVMYQVSEAMGEINVCFEVEGNNVLDVAGGAILNTLSGSATASVDFTPLTNEEVELPVGASIGRQFCRRIVIVQDGLQEDLESFMVLLASTSPFVAINPDMRVATVTILGERIVFQFSQTNYNVSEGDGIAEVCIDLTSGVLSANTSIMITLQPGTAGTLGFKLISQTVVFPVGSVAGESSCFNITFNDDTLMEVSESFSVRAVSSNPNVEFSPGGDMATVTIMDNDGSGLGSGQIPPSQCAQTFQIEQDVIDINIISGVVTCFSCALDSTGPGDVVWLVEMDGNLVPVSTLSNAVADGNFLIIEMPDDFFPPGPSGRRNISCISLVNGQTFEARLVSMDIRCGAETTSTENGMSYSWPATLAGETVVFSCPTRPNVLVMRNCSSEGLWQNVTDDGCESVIEQLFRLCLSFENLTTETYVESVAMFSQIIELTEDNVNDQTDIALGKTASLFKDLAEFVNAFDVIINTTVIEDVVDVIDSFLQWEPENITSVSNSSCLVESFETIASTYAQQVSLDEIQKFITPSFTLIVEMRSVNSLSQSGRSFLIGASDLLLAFGDQVVPARLPDQFDAAISLPPSLFQQIADRLYVGIFFAYYEIPTLFPVAREIGRSSLPRQRVVGSNIIAATVGPDLNFQNLIEPVVVLLQLQISEDSFIVDGSEMCVSWDFTLQGWTTEGCITLVGDDGVITCNCSHLTNFAVLVDICLREEDCERSRVDTPLTYISYVGVSVSIVCLIFTLLTLLVFKKIREKDISKYHIQLCFSLLCMYILTLILVVLSAEKVTTIYGGCVSLSLLVHYFTLAAVMWMGAEALLMFQKLVIIFVRITTRFMIITSIICWTLPIIFVLVPFIVDMANGRDDASDLIIQRPKTKDDISYCFLSNIGALMGSFLAPIFVIIVVNVFFFIWVVIVLARHTKGIARRTKQAVSNKQILRIMFSITGVLFLFGITWGFFILTFSVTGLRETFQTLFTVFNSLQGFFIFAFIFFTEGFGYWKELMRCNRMHKPKSTQTSAPTTKPSNFPNKVRVHETDSSEISGLHGKNLESNTRNRKLEPTLSSAASSMELTSADTSCSGTKVQDDDNDIVYSNDYIVDSEQHDIEEEEGRWRITTDAMPLKVLIKRYSTKQYKQHHVEEMKVEFFDEA